MNTSWLIVFVLLTGLLSRAEAQAPAPLRARLEFALLQQDGTPLGRRLRVHLYSAEGEVPEAIESDGTGLVRLERLLAGRYDLWVEGAGEEKITSALFHNLEITPGEETQRLDLKLPPAGTVRGCLLLADGATPARGFTVSVQSGTVPAPGTEPRRWAAAYARGVLNCYAQAEVGADGAFTLHGLAPGDHVLDVRRPGERLPWCSLDGVKVTAGQTTDLGTVRVAANGWQHLLDPGLRSAWKESELYGRREVRFEPEQVVLERGSDMTGIHWTGELPRVDYEVTLQGMRVEGSDFFCGLTFPVNQDPCTLILGGWGGSVVGLSSLNGADASQNETTQWIRFDNGRWYRIRLRVTGERIQAWLDHRQIINVELKGKKLSIRWEVEPSRPFGIATWRTTGALRDLRIRRLDPHVPGQSGGGSAG